MRSSASQLPGESPPSPGICHGHIETEQLNTTTYSDLYRRCGCREPHPPGRGELDHRGEETGGGAGPLGLNRDKWSTSSVTRRCFAVSTGVPRPAVLVERDSEDGRRGGQGRDRGTVDVPEPHAAIGAGGSQDAAVRALRHAVHIAGRPGQSGPCRQGPGWIAYVVDPHGLVGAADRHAGAVGGERGRIRVRAGDLRSAEQCRARSALAAANIEPDGLNARLSTRLVGWSKCPIGHGDAGSETFHSQTW